MIQQKSSGFFKKNLLKGRSLHVDEINEEINDETNHISVDRENILSSSFSELKYINDFTLTFEVDFIGEDAKDLGLPSLLHPLQ